MENKGLEIISQEIPEKENVKIFILKGSLDMVTTPKLNEIVEPFIQKEDFCVMLEISGINYMNSTGLANILRYHIQLKRRNGSFKLISPNSYIYEILDVTGAVKLLEIHNSIEEALKTCP